MTNTPPPGWIVPRRIVLQSGGSRGAASADVHLIAGAGPYGLEILMCEHKKPDRLQMAGQVTRAGSPCVDLDLALVEAWAPDVVTDTRTDRFGEFDLVSSTSGCFGVRLGDGDDALHVLVWCAEPAE